jgi:hypothetical protein
MEQHVINEQVKESLPARAQDMSEKNIVDKLKEVVDDKETYTGLQTFINVDAVITYNGIKVSVQKLCENLKGDLKKSEDIRKLEVFSIEKDNNNFIKSITVKAIRKNLVQRIIK